MTVTSVSTATRTIDYFYTRYPTTCSIEYSLEKDAGTDSQPQLQLWTEISKGASFVWNPITDNTKAGVPLYWRWKA